MEKKASVPSSPTKTKKDIAYVGIKDMIINGRFDSRDPLVERQLCQEPVSYTHLLPLSRSWHGKLHTVP